VIGPGAAAAAALGWLRRPAPSGGWRALWRVPRDARRVAALRHREFPLLNTPHAFAGALQDTLAVALIAGITGEASAGFWGLALRYLKAPASLVGGAVSQALYPRLVEA
jgi:O-antigen/teichoic acid export membrane protein